MIATRARTRTFTTILLFSLLAATALLGTTSGLPSSPYGYNDDDDDDPSEFSSLDQSSPCSLEDAKLPNCGKYAFNDPSILYRDCHCDCDRDCDCDCTLHAHDTHTPLNLPIMGVVAYKFLSQLYSKSGFLPVWSSPGLKRGCGGPWNWHSELHLFLRVCHSNSQWSTCNTL